MYPPAIYRPTPNVNPSGQTLWIALGITAAVAASVGLAVYLTRSRTASINLNMPSGTGGVTLES